MTLPFDPDIDVVDPASAPGVRWGHVAGVFGGAFVGGLLRYGVSQHWPSAPGTFPLTVFGINTAGTFVLAIVIVLAAQMLPRATYLRPVAGTGFCGAFTTFSSLATADDLLLAHGHAGLALTYLVTSVGAGLAAATAGLAVARWFATWIASKAAA